MQKNDKLSKSEFKEMLSLIKRHAETDMDQFSTWKFDSSRGPIFICISNGPVVTDEENHCNLSHLVGSN